MWYRFAGLQDEVEKLRIQGINEPILALFSDPKYDNASKGKMLGAIKQNPNISIEELRNLSSQNKPTKGEQFILARFENERFKNWFFHKLKSWRIQPAKPDGEYDHNTPKENLGEHANFIELAIHMQDFVNNIEINDPDYNLGLRSWEEVVQDTDEWESMLQGRGSSKFYNPADRNEIMKHPDGWSMVEVISENDLDVEGAKMHHCVAGYWEQVRKGNTKIYSLRDPGNQPHVTIEVVGDKVKQVKGHNNKKITEDDLVEKIKEFFESQDDIEKDIRHNPIEHHFENWEDGIYWTYDPEEIDYNIHRSTYGPEEYEFDDLDDDLPEDFNRFGINSPVFDYKKFSEGNLYQANMTDITTNVVDSITNGLSKNRSAYNYGDRKEYTIEDYDLDDYADKIYEGLVAKANLALSQAPISHDFRKYLDARHFLEVSTKEYESMKEKYQEDSPAEDFATWYQNQPEFLWFLIAEKIQEWFEKSHFAFKFKEIRGEEFKLPSGYKKWWHGGEESENITPFINTKEIRETVLKDDEKFASYNNNNYRKNWVK